MENTKEFVLAKSIVSSSKYISKGLIYSSVIIGFSIIFYKIVKYYIKERNNLKTIKEYNGKK